MDLCSLSLYWYPYYFCFVETILIHIIDIPIGSMVWFSQYTRGQWPKSPCWNFSNIWPIPLKQIEVVFCSVKMNWGFDWFACIFSDNFKILKESNRTKIVIYNYIILSKVWNEYNIIHYTIIFFQVRQLNARVIGNSWQGAIHYNSLQ